MKLKACSLFLGYREFNASVQTKTGKHLLHVDQLGTLVPMEYIKQGFRVIQANRSELEALVSGGYENKRIFLRFYRSG